MNMTPNDRMESYRNRMKEKGLRPVQIWVPNTRLDSFQKHLKSQINGLNIEHESSVLEFFGSVSDRSQWF